MNWGVLLTAREKIQMPNAVPRFSDVMEPTCYHELNSILFIPCSNNPTR